MKAYRRIVVCTAFVLAGLGSARAAELAGKWKAEFDTQIGVQKYTYEFKSDAGKLTGKAAFERPDGKGEIELKEVKATKDEVTFVELLKYQDQEIRIEYTGKFTNDDELKLSRKVGDFATEELVAKRTKEK
jgi:hypothetical protein